jgi:uncharacterized protein
MLVDFEVENFRSYRETKRFSLVASSAKELPQNLIDTGLGLNLVRTAAIYGPNASGKSNLLAAMNWVSEILDSPMNRSLTAEILVSPFGLDRISATNPSRFRVNFVVEGVLYEYSIAVRSKMVDEERLVAHPHGRPQEWFHRRGKEVDFNSTYLKGQKQSLRGMTPDNTPLLAVAAAFGHRQLLPPARWLARNLCDRFDTLESPKRGPGIGQPWEKTARLCHQDRSFHEWVNAFLRHADLGIQEVQIEVIEQKTRRPVSDHSTDGMRIITLGEFPEERHEPVFVHSGDDGVTARFSLSNESDGTRRLFAMLAPLYELLRDGGLAAVDELSASLHPSLVRELVRVFHDPQLNPKGSQLVFATHDTSLLSRKLFRRDQIWFTEKNHGGATDLYSLHDVKGVLADEPFEKGYTRGRYGAIPFFGQLDFPPVSEEASRRLSKGAL